MPDAPLRERGIQCNMTPPRLSSALSLESEPGRAADAACGKAVDALGDDCDVAFVFFTHHHRDAGETIARIARDRLGAGCLVAMSVEGVAAHALEVERAPGITVLAARLPGTRVKSALVQQLDPHSADGLGAMTGLDDAEFRGGFLFADPFSVPLVNLLPGLDRAREGRGVVIGGMASGAEKPGQNLIVVNDHAMTGGGVFVTLAGACGIDVLVSQGCRGFGPTFVVTGAKRNVIMTLGGRRALDAARETIGELLEEERELLRGGLFLGLVADEHKERFGRDDYLVRNVLGGDETTGSIAIADAARVGQTVRFHMRDATTAHEDLAMLLDARKLHEPPAGALLVTCNGRGTRLFRRANHDAGAIQRAFAEQEDAASRAKPGETIDPAKRPPIPLAGFSAAGEIGPIAGRTSLHGHTACVAFFREHRPPVMIPSA